MGNSPQNSKKGDQTEHGNISIIYKKKKQNVVSVLIEIKFYF